MEMASRDKRSPEHSSDMLRDLEREHSKQREKMNRGTSPRSQQGETQLRESEEDDTVGESS